MSEEEEVAFDDWEAEIANLETEKIEQAPNKEQLKQNDESSQQNKDEANSNKKNEVDPLLSFQAKIKRYQGLTNQQFQEEFQNIIPLSQNKTLKMSNQILKSENDFNQFAKTVAKRFVKESEDTNQDNLKDQNILTFFEEAILYLYEGFQWKNFHQILNKLKPIKRERKSLEEKIRKQKEKEERQNKSQKQVESEQKLEKIQSKIQNHEKETELFGEAGSLNSKQIEEEMKNKAIKKVEVKVVQDDDDFM